MAFDATKNWGVIFVNMDDVQRTMPNESESSPAPLYDPRNKLNDLSSKEWTYALGSVLFTRYPTRGANSMAHHIRRAHPSPKPPQLIAELLQFFTKKHGHVLDLFSGAGGSLLACSIEQRNGVGVELNADYQQLYEQASDYLALPKQHYVIGDVCNPATYAQLSQTTFDLIIADPPYGSMLARKRTGHRAKRGTGDATPFSSNHADLGNMERDAFFEKLTLAIRNALPLLRHHGHVIMFIKDLQPTAEHHNMLHADVVDALKSIEGLRFRGYRIWHDANINRFPFGYPHTFVANQTHQFILIFRKE
jgi:DNA modification methylase